MFVVNILESGQEELSRRFADQHEDRFDGIGYHRSPEGLILLDGALAHIECERFADLPRRGPHDRRRPGDRRRPPATATRCSTTAAATPRSDDRPDTLASHSARHRAARRPGRRSRDGRRARSATSRAPTAGSAAPPPCGTGWHRVLRGVPPGRRSRCSTSAPALGDLPRARRRAGPAGGDTCCGRVGLERSRPAAALARERPACPARSPAPARRRSASRSVDIVLVSQVAHHLTRRVRGSPVPHLRPRWRGWAVIVADLRRGRLAPLAFWVGARGARLRSGHHGGRTDLDPPRLHRRRAARAARGGGRSRAIVDAAAGIPPGRHLADRRLVMRPSTAPGCAPRWTRVLPGRGGRRGALARAAAATTAGSACWSGGADGGRGGDGRLAAVRPAQLSHLVGLGDAGGPRGAGGALPPRPRHHGRHGRGLAVRAGGRRDRRDASCTSGPGPRWPLIGGPPPTWVIGPVFIHGIASRTLAGIKRARRRRGAAVTATRACVASS